jgi:hypothetical protein
LKDINPCYADLQINDTNEVHQAMAALPGQLFDTQNVIDDDTLVQLDRVAVGNPAHSVDHPDMQPLHDDLNKMMLHWSLKMVFHNQLIMSF